MEDDAAVYFVDAIDGISLFVFLRITATDQHDTDSSTFVELDGALVKVSFSHTFEKIHDVTLQTEHHTLCLRVTHTTIVFNDHRVSLHIDKSEEDKAFIVDTLGFQSLNSRTDNAILYLLHPFPGGERHRGYRTHTTGVQTRVVFSDTLVVLCLWQNLIVFTICQYEDTALDTTQKFLDDHL